MRVESNFLQAFSALPGVKALWIGRIPDVPVEVSKDPAMCRLRSRHRDFVKKHYEKSLWWRAEQVHGNGVAVVPQKDVWIGSDGLPLVPGVDGLLTKQPDQVLGIYVADCGPIWLADRKTGAVGLLHSGKKGTELKILPKAVARMQEEFETKAEDLIAVLGPCIRPPDYEVDFATEIGRQAAELGIGEFHDCGENTAEDLEQYYSYRAEKGKTGRMLALIAIKNPA